MFLFGLTTAIYKDSKDEYVYLAEKQNGLST